MLLRRLKNIDGRSVFTKYESIPSSSADDYKCDNKSNYDRIKMVEKHNYICL